MKRALLLAIACAVAVQTHAATYYVIVAGLGGEPDYDQRFTAAAKDLDKIFKASGPAAHVYTLSGPQATATQLTETMGAVARDAKDRRRLCADPDWPWFVRRRGIQVQSCWAGCDREHRSLRYAIALPQSASLLWTRPARAAARLQALDRPGRAVIAATKSGTEKNATVFARYWVEALQDPSAADVDKSDSISAMEAFTYAAKQDRGILRLAKTPGHRARGL